MLSTIDWWIIGIGALCASACALPGTLLVLQRMSLMGDAISHTVLPGIAIAFLITQSRDPILMLIAAIVIGVLTALLVQIIHIYGKVEVGASMGIVFTVLFALGLILIRQAMDYVHIDPDCVLYGSIEFAYFDQVPFFGYMLPKSFIVNGFIFCLNLLLILLFYKEFKITAFDSALAKTHGFKPELMHYFLMTMTAITVVAAFESVGSILVIAMLIVPPATAYLLTDRYWLLLTYSVLFACLASFFGHLGAIVVPPWFGFSGTVTSGAIAVAAGFFFILTWLFSPKYGLIMKFCNYIFVRFKVLAEDILGILWRLEERNQGVLDRSILNEAIGANRIFIYIVLKSLVKTDLIQIRQGSLLLTNSGRNRATAIVRSHRLWEVYLDKHFPQDKFQIHHSASRLEHITTKDMQARLGEAEQDPHGSNVPNIDEDLE